MSLKRRTKNVLKASKNSKAAVWKQAALDSYGSPHHTPGNYRRIRRGIARNLKESRNYGPLSNKTRVRQLYQKKPLAFMDR